MRRVLLPGLLAVALAALLFDHPWPATAAAPARRFEYALVQPDGNTSCAISDLDAMTPVLGRLQTEAEDARRPVLWFRSAGRDYEVHDSTLTARASEIVRPMQELGEQQGKLGAEQGHWGELQGRLGALQGRIGQLQARIAAARTGDAGHDQPGLDDLERQLDALSQEAQQLGEEQSELGEQQRKLGAKQAKLGRRQSEVSQRALADLEALAREALASGKAEAPTPHTGGQP